MKNKQRIIRLSLAVVVTASIGIFIASRLSFDDLLAVFYKANLRIILICLLISGVSSTVLISYRWKRIILRFGHYLSFKETLIIKMGSRILPFKTNEISRVVYLRRVKGIHYKVAVLSVVSEYLVSMVVLLSFMVIGSIGYFWGVEKKGYLPAFFLLNKSKCFGKNARNNRIKKYVRTFNSCLSESWIILRDKKIITATVIYWSLDILNMFLLSIAINNPLPLFALIFLLPVVIIIGNIPISIGGLGLRDITLIALFYPWGSIEVLLALSLLYYLTEHLFPNLLAVMFSGAFVNRMIWRQ